MSAELAREVKRRRTFAIISHPDAGKTTLTENLLLMGGAIRSAGAVRARGEQRRTRSDWMKIERERGISVSASVMTFEFDGCIINLLDTPGHEDFSEDTYRTLTAADSAVMVLDAAKGIEPQTLKLFEVCRLRDIPILTFINKMDREAQDPLELLDEVASKLALDPAPIYWPQGAGPRFRGMIDLRNDMFTLFRRPQIGDTRPVDHDTIPLSSHSIDQVLSRAEIEELWSSAELVRGGYPAFSLSSYLEGHMTPVFFGSALRQFGVRELLGGLRDYAPPPRDQEALEKGVVSRVLAHRDEVSGFVFKIQANMDPAHRDRIAMVRLASGKFHRGMRLKTGSGKQISVHAPLMFVGQDREITDEAWAGDVIGVPNHGVLRVGDSLSESGTIKFSGIPNFAPDILRRASVKDPLKAKHLKKALESLAEEGVTQLFRPYYGSDLIVGAVGPLQFDVLVERLAAEYGLAVVFEACAFNGVRWIFADTPSDLVSFADRNQVSMGLDLDGAEVFLAKNVWEIGYVAEKFPKIRFSNVRERMI
ncbi:peptide chain release factor 3 [Candidatus Phycosocius spiralis]|uniref:Peptide chain release factor 3 n=1 Tax=Candidatus Phycosocius spiralis TaxID=2815099 RepID=A0ABQ4PYI2_9PROT|nr:peptide chain release factor 3 [Candidatus Phycosocius spiralis]GIU68035.1 peptide chain release factor 3 [Candidatus Phycosocius spiralis]